MARPCCGRLVRKPCILALCILPGGEPTAFEHLGSFYLSGFPRRDFAHAYGAHDWQEGGEITSDQRAYLLDSALFHHQVKTGVAARDKPVSRG